MYSHNGSFYVNPDKGTMIGIENCIRLLAGSLSLVREVADDCPEHKKDISFLNGIQDEQSF